MTPSSPAARWSPERLDVKSLARAAGQIDGQTPLERFARLHQDMHLPDPADAVDPVVWHAQGELRADAQGQLAEIWLHLKVSAGASLQCQRCLGPVKLPLSVDRWFRFVADEAIAEAEDDECEEDLLVLAPTMSLLELIEDELLMELPLVPMHEICPAGAVAGLTDPVQEAEPGMTEKPNPFAVLAKLKK